MVEALKLEQEVKSLDIPKKTNDDVKKKKKSFFERLFRKNKLKKPNKVAVVYLRNNGVAEFMEVEVKRGFFNISGRTYHENRDCIYRINKEGIPLAIIPEWNLIPIGTKNWDDKSMQEKFAELQDHAIRGIRHAELVRMGDKDYSKINVKGAIGIGIIIVIITAVIMQVL